MIQMSVLFQPIISNSLLRIFNAFVGTINWKYHVLFYFMTVQLFLAVSVLHNISLGSDGSRLGEPPPSRGCGEVGPGGWPTTYGNIIPLSQPATEL